MILAYKWTQGHVGWLALTVGSHVALFCVYLMNCMNSHNDDSTAATAACQVLLAATTRIWNSSPDDIVSAQTLLFFHWLLKTYIVSHVQKLHSDQFCLISTFC